MREALEFLLQLPWSNPANAPVKEINCLADALQGANLTVQDKILVAQIVAAVKGNTRAATYLRDTAGQTFLPDKTSGAMTEYEDDGFTEAVKASAIEVWGERRGNKTKAANKAGGPVRKVQSETDADTDVVDGQVAVQKS